MPKSLAQREIIIYVTEKVTSTACFGENKLFA